LRHYWTDRRTGRQTDMDITLLHTLYLLDKASNNNLAKYGKYEAHLALIITVTGVRCHMMCHQSRTVVVNVMSFH